MSITLADIDHAEQATKAVKSGLRHIAREIYEIRNGEALARHWCFYDYTRRNYSGQYHDEQDGPDWGADTPILIVTFEWSYNGGADYAYVTFPQSWLEQDWKGLERARMEAVRCDEEEQERVEELKRAGEIEAAERATLERLKAKYEGNTHAALSLPEHAQDSRKDS